MKSALKALERFSVYAPTEFGEDSPNFFELMLSQAADPAALRGDTSLLMVSTSLLSSASSNS
jgi:hypothetical protein